MTTECLLDEHGVGCMCISFSVLLPSLFFFVVHVCKTISYFDCMHWHTIHGVHLVTLCKHGLRHKRTSILRAEQRHLLISYTPFDLARFQIASSYIQSSFALLLLPITIYILYLKSNFGRLSMHIFFYLLI